MRNDTLRRTSEYQMFELDILEYIFDKKHLIFFQGL